MTALSDMRLHAYNHEFARDRGDPWGDRVGISIVYLLIIQVQNDVLTIYLGEIYFTFCRQNRNWLI